MRTHTYTSNLLFPFIFFEMSIKVKSIILCVTSNRVPQEQMADQDIQEAKEDEYVASTISLNSNWYSLMWLFHPINTYKVMYK